MQDFYAANDYPCNGQVVAITPKTFREIVHEELAEADIAYEEYVTPAGLLELEIDTGTGWVVVLVFHPEGGLLAMDIELHEDDEDEEDEEEDDEQ